MKPNVRIKELMKKAHIKSWVFRIFGWLFMIMSLVPLIRLLFFRLGDLSQVQIWNPHSVTLVITSGALTTMLWLIARTFFSQGTAYALRCGQLEDLDLYTSDESASISAENLLGALVILRRIKTEEVAGASIPGGPNEVLKSIAEAMFKK